MSKVIEITDHNFDAEVLNSKLPAEVDFWAPTCGPCSLIAPIYDKLAEEYDGRFKFCKINVTENQEMTVKYQIFNVPVQLFFYNGEKIDEIIGAYPEQTIRTKIEGILQSHSTGEMGTTST